MSLRRLGNDTTTSVHDRRSDTTAIQTLQELAWRGRAVDLLQGCAAGVGQLVGCDAYHGAVVVDVHVADAPCEIAAEVDIVPGEAGDGPEFWAWKA